MRLLVLGFFLALTGCAGPGFMAHPPESPFHVLSTPDTLGSPLVILTAEQLAILNPPPPAADETGDDVFEPQSVEQYQPVPGELIDRVLSPSGIPYRIVNRRRMIMTAYNSEPRQTDSTPWIMANGRMPVPGSAACNGLAIGTRVRIPEVFGDAIFTIEDRMAEDQGLDHIDVWVYHINDAYALRHPTVTVDILGPPNSYAPR